VNPFSALASFNNWLRRYRIGPVRANWILLGLLAFGLLFAAYNAVLRARQDPEPHLTKLSEIFSVNGTSNDHVEVTGLLFPKTHLVYPALRDNIRSTVQYTYVAMIEDDPKRVLLVRFRGDFGQGEPRHATVSGLLVVPDTTLRRYLKAKGWKIGGLPIEDRYYLLAGSRPIPVWLFVVVTAILALILGPLLVSEYRCLKVRE
jgi:hypothetical protein